MIEPSNTDKGRAVIYRANPMATPEYGVITSQNLMYVFVLFVGQEQSKACNREDLYWPEAKAEDVQLTPQAIGSAELVPETMYVIWSEEHAAWWGAGKWGYTGSIVHAGRYNPEQAARIVREANVVNFNEIAIPVPPGLPNVRHQQEF